jgi:Bacterial TSP3 repeat
VTRIRSTGYLVSRGKNCLLLLALFCFPFVATSSVFSQVAPDQETVGTPWAGEKGVAETMSAIMARQHQANLVAKGKPKKIKLKKERENPERDHLSQNPDSPNVARWVPSQSIADDSVTPLAPLAPQTFGTSFTGATLAETGAFPPDSMGAVGPSQFVVFVNGRLRSFNKASGVADGVLNVDPDVFFATVMTPVSPPVLQNFTSDPQVRYDRLSGRWFLTIIDVPCTNANCYAAANRLLIAVSDAASAGVISGGTIWTFFYFQSDATNFLDYPSLGVDANALYIGGNMFNSAGSSFLGCNAYVVRKSSVLGGGPLVVTTFTVVSSAIAAGPFAPRGVDNYDPASNEGYFIGVDNATFGTLMMRRVSDPGGTPSISGNASITVSSTSFPIPVDHLGNTGGNNGRLDALDDRLFAAHIRSGRLWTAHNIKVSSSGVGTTFGGQLRDGVRWYELNVPVGSGAPTVVQSGTIFDNANQTSAARQFWIPSVMVSGQGHAAIGFSTAGTPYRADAATAGRLATDTLGTLQSVTNYTSSSTAYNPLFDPGGSNGRRWGDYSFTSLDPNDDMTMWTIQEFCDSTDSYGVRVVKLFAPPPATPFNCSPSVITQGVANAIVVVSGFSTTGSGFFDPGTNFPNHISAAVNGGSVTVNSVIYNNPTNISLNLTVAAGAGVGSRTITVTNPDGQTATSTAGILTIATGGTNSLPVISAASVTPSSPSTTNNLLATITSAFDANGDPITFAYQWQESTTNLFGQTSSNLLAAATFAGGSYGCVITPNDSHGDGAPFTTASVLVPVDFDGNGLNDDWEVQNFGHIGVDPNADPDGDGFSNAQELAAGTDPNDEASALRITSIAANGPDVVIDFTTSSNKFYDVQYNVDLTLTNWSTVVTNVAGTGGIEQATDAGAASLTNRFYRVLLLQ